MTRDCTLMEDDKERQVAMGSRLLLLRKKKGMSQTEVGEAIGAKFVTISRYECGVRDPSTRDLWRLARLFRVTIDWIVTGKDKAWEEV